MYCINININKKNIYIYNTHIICIVFTIYQPKTTSKRRLGCPASSAPRHPPATPRDPTGSELSPRCPWAKGHLGRPEGTTAGLRPEGWGSSDHQRVGPHIPSCDQTLQRKSHEKYSFPGGSTWECSSIYKWIENIIKQIMIISKSGSKSWYNIISKIFVQHSYNISITLV